MAAAAAAAAAAVPVAVTGVKRKNDSQESEDVTDFLREQVNRIRGPKLPRLSASEVARWLMDRDGFRARFTHNAQALCSDD